jgi:hypothetical protein
MSTGWRGAGVAIIEDSIELAVDICDDMAELSIADDGIADVSVELEAEVSAGAELSIADDEAIIDESMADEDDWAKAPPISTALSAVLAIRSRIIVLSYVIARRAGFKATTFRRRSCSTEFLWNQIGFFWPRWWGRKTC